VRKSGPRATPFAELIRSDYLRRYRTDHEILERINALITETVRQLFSGIGKPEPLKNALAGYWSRRINDEHRIVYKIVDGSLLIAQLRYHY
jgi:toxin YoeB